ncbi:MAG: 30S ribosomal protein S6 [Microgenomates group bacterium]
MEKQYELIALFATKTNDIMAEKTLVDLVKASKFKVVEVDKWGIKPLAYPIKKENKAYYLRLVIEEGDAKALANALKVEESLLRHLLIVGKEKK